MKKLSLKTTLIAVFAAAAFGSLFLTPEVPPAVAQVEVPPAEVEPSPTEVAERWPGNVIPYYIDPNVSDDHKQGIEAAIEIWQNRTAVSFRLITFGELQSVVRPRYLHYIDRGNQYHSYNYQAIVADGDLAAFPYLKPGDWVIKFAQCTRGEVCGDKEPWGDDPHIPLHETGHVLGLPHEAKRSDRNEVVRYYPCCVDESKESFTKGDQHVQALKPYDIKSVMQYGSESQCKKSGGKCICLPLLEKTSATYVRDDTIASGDQQVKEEGSCVISSNVKGRVIAPPGGLSYEDVNAIYQMYPPKLGKNEAGDEFGQAMAAGDFDGDGYSDLAVGAPGEAPGSQPNSGVVFLFKGTFTGLVSWRTLTQKGLGANQAGDRFGATLAAGDLNGDNRAELIVGAPEERISQSGPNPRAGAVFVFPGSDTGPTAKNGYLLHQDNIGFGGTSEDDDLFGAALAVGNFNGDDRLDVAIGAPGKNPGGLVFVMTWDKTRPAGDKLVKFSTRLGTQRAAGDRFGTALVAADVNNDGFDDLVVGAPGTRHTGSIFIFPGLSSDFHVPAEIRQPLGSTRETGDEFGAALATGHFSNGARPQIVVGAPGKKGTGKVYVMRLAYNGRNFDRIDKWNSYDQGSLAGDNLDDRFGEFLAVADFDQDGKDDLAVGIPSKDILQGTTLLRDAGAVALFRGNTSDEFLIDWTFYVQPDSYFSLREEDRFGGAVAAANFNGKSGNPELAIGVPGKDGNFIQDWGAMFVARGQESAGSPPFLSQTKNPSKAQLPPNVSFWTYFDQEQAGRR